MKIAIVSPKLFPALAGSAVDSFGGAEVALGLVARELACEDGIAVHAIVGDYGQPPVTERDDVTIRRGMLANAGVLGNGIRLILTMSDVNADVYIQRSLAVATTLIALYCRWRSKKFIYWVAHDSETDGSHPLSRSALTAWLVRLMYRSASRVVVQNEYEQEQLSRRYPGIQCAIIKKGVVPREPSIEEKRFDAIWVGRCDDWKKPDAFIDLSRHNPASRFVMICPPAVNKETQHAEIRRAAESCPNLEFHGRLAHSDVLMLMNASKMLCITSSQEGDWPSVVLEAASLGVPILSLSLNYSGLIDEFGGGVCCVGDPEKMREEFARLVRDEAELEDLGRGARYYVQTTHDVGSQTSKLLGLLNGLDR